ncbi:MAG: hypothetical protein KA015_02325 [Spirochaetes bacterium]|nr:hypothetical protein [Spirochaetota bacterium]
MRDNLFMKLPYEDNLKQFEHALLSMNRKEAARILSGDFDMPGIERIESLVIPALKKTSAVPGKKGMLPSPRSI